MSGDANVELVGLDQAFADMGRWADDLPAAVAAGSVGLAQRVADTIRAKVPVLSGQLAGSVESVALDDGPEVGMGDGLDYAGWIEFGGSRGRPYIPEGRYVYPSAAAATDEFIQAASDAATDSIERFSWSTPH